MTLTHKCKHVPSALLRLVSVTSTYEKLRQNNNKQEREKVIVRRPQTREGIQVVRLWMS